MKPRDTPAPLGLLGVAFRARVRALIGASDGVCGGPE